MSRDFVDLSDAGGPVLAAMINDAIDRKAARKGLPRASPMPTLRWTVMCWR